MPKATMEKQNKGPQRPQWKNKIKSKPKFPLPNEQIHWVSAIKGETSSLLTNISESNTYTKKQVNCTNTNSM